MCQFSRLQISSGKYQSYLTAINSQSTDVTHYMMDEIVVLS